MGTHDGRGGGRPSAWRAFWAVAGRAAGRPWAGQAVGWAAVGLLAVLAGAVAAVTHGPIGWHPADRRVRVADRSPGGAVVMTYRRYAEERLTMYQAVPGPADQAGVLAAAFAPFRAAVGADADLGGDWRGVNFTRDWAFVTFTRWAVFALYLGFLLPLSALAVGSAAVGAEREGRTLLWLATRPLPRSAVYLATFVGTAPWAAAAAVGGLGAVGAAGGPLGRQAFLAYWPAAAGGAVAFAALFHLLGATVRRPAVVGLVYVFFFETLVANLPGSLKQLSLNYYVRSLMYDAAGRRAAAVTPAGLDVYAPADPATAWAVLAAATVGLTAVGMAVFARQEHGDD